MEGSVVCVVRSQTASSPALCDEVFVEHNQWLVSLSIPIPVPYNRTLNVSAFTPFNLTCFGAFPGENLGWQRDGIMLSVESGFVTIQDDILIIPDSHPSDSGQYTCQSSDTGAILNNYDVTFTVG